MLVYIVLALTFGFALLTTEIALGRKTRQGPLTAYGIINKKFRATGLFAWLVPIIILDSGKSRIIKMINGSKTTCAVISFCRIYNNA